MDESQGTGAPTSARRKPRPLPSSCAAPATKTHAWLHELLLRVEAAGAAEHSRKERETLRCIMRTLSPSSPAACLRGLQGSGKKESFTGVSASSSSPVQPQIDTHSPKVAVPSYNRFYSKVSMGSTVSKRPRFRETHCGVAAPGNGCSMRPLSGDIPPATPKQQASGIKVASTTPSAQLQCLAAEAKAIGRGQLKVAAPSVGQSPAACTPQPTLHAVTPASASSNPGTLAPSSPWDVPPLPTIDVSAILGGGPTT